MFVAEGPNVVRALLASSYRTRSVLLAEEQVDRFGPELAGSSALVYVVTRELLYEVVRFKLHQGVLACGERRPLPDAAALLSGTRVVALLESLNDHENLGLLFRSARAFGVGAVLLDERCADPLYRRCVRVSMGHVLHVPHTRVATAAEGLALLRAAGFTLVALTPDPAATELVRPGGAPQRRIALLLGAEGPGLSPELLEQADLRARIPIDPAVDSLNVAVAASIAFHCLASG